MAQTKEGAERLRARYLGLTVDELRSKEDAGLAWCGKCHQWKTFAQFHRDKSRWGGVSRKCIACRTHPKKTEKLTKEEAASGRAKGLARCFHCRTWLPLTEVKNGLCREHIRAYARKRYAEDARYRAERREHSHARKRNADPINADDQEFIFREFGGRCAYCDNPATTFDHIVPICDGGSSVPINIVACCLSCNCSKNSHNAFDWLEKRGIDPRNGLLERLVAAIYAV